MINKKVVLIFTLVFILVMPLIISQSSNKVVLSIVLNYDNGNIHQGNISLIETSEELNKKELNGNYTLKVFSFLNEELYKTSFDFSLEILSSPPKEWFDSEGNQIYAPNETEVGRLNLEKTSKALFVPYFKTGKLVIISDKSSKELLKIDISAFATCNQNKICDNQESKETCPEDCSNIQIKTNSSFWQKLLDWIKSWI